MKYYDNSILAPTVARMIDQSSVWYLCCAARGCEGKADSFYSARASPNLNWVLGSQ